jgi:polyketide synthase 2/polyketide synthase 5
MDSRSLTFAEETLALTGNEGVDVVLNSLAGEAIQQGIRILRPCGRFLELGRKEILADQPIGMGIFSRGRLFSSIDIDFRGEMLRRVFSGLSSMLDNQVFKPLAMRTFPISGISEAFAYLSNGGHIGKAVLQVKDVVVEVTPEHSSN